MSNDTRACERNSKIYNSILELIGDTPVIRLNRISRNIKSDILVKLEYTNPSGSIKDRIAYEMINQAESEGKLKAGYTIIESSTGNTGIALSFVGTLKGYKVLIYETMPGKAGSEKTKIMQNLGAEVKLLEPEDIKALEEKSTLIEKLLKRNKEFLDIIEEAKTATEALFHIAHHGQTPSTEIAKEALEEISKHIEKRRGGNV